MGEICWIATAVSSTECCAVAGLVFIAVSSLCQSLHASSLMLRVQVTVCMTCHTRQCLLLKRLLE